MLPNRMGGTVRSTLQDIDEDLISQMREHATAYAASTPVRRVAVVANAPLEPSEQPRDLIDPSALVIRCNSLALDGPGDPPTVGTRTNVVVAARTTRPSPAFLRDYRKRAYFVGDSFHAVVQHPPGWPLQWPEDLGAWMIPNRAIGLPLRYLLHPTRAGHNVFPTTGTQAVYLAYRLFPDADIFLTGFSVLHDPAQKSWRYHLSDLAPANIPRWHKLDREAAYLQG